MVAHELLHAGRLIVLSLVAQFLCLFLELVGRTEGKVLIEVQSLDLYLALFEQFQIL